MISRRRQVFRVYRTLLTAAAVIAAVGTPLWDATADGTTVEQIQEMRTLLDSQGIGALLASAAANGWTAPVMPSAWYVTSRATPEELPLRQAARDLGRALLLAIDGWAPRMLTDTGDALLEKARTLIDLAYWVGPTEGYGNLFIERRARGVAVTALGRLVVDLSYPLDGPVSQLQRVRVPFHSPGAVARVMNFEAGAALFPENPRSMEEVATYWDLRSFRYREHTRPTPQYTPRPDPVDALDALTRASMRALGLNPAVYDERDSFVFDGPCPRPGTLLQCWDAKEHERLMVETVEGPLKDLEYLVTFRQVIGAFPLTPARPHPFWPPGNSISLSR